MSEEKQVGMAAVSRDSSIGRILLEMGKITPEDAEQILRIQREKGMRFGEAAQHLGLVTEADIQGVLAHQFDYPYLQAGHSPYPVDLVAAFHPFSVHVEALRAVRSQLMLRWFAQGEKALMVAAINSGEGASFLAANLAIVFSQLGEHTLLVDANLRTPCQHKLFCLEGRQGLSDILAGRAGLDVIQRTNAFVDLSVLQAGTLPPNPQELLARTSFGALNDELCKRYDVVLYDTSDFASSADALTIASRVGGVLLAVRKDKTRLSDVNVMNEQVQRSNAEVVGSVLLEF
ncbi:chain length determinant protein tyrosine kinase EpsG [Massilia sp. W12]|uniref:chain length determinant protein tyrosine kinase EpsG n=1 Tax=Massilia sp. W12 TaxID=3126507 RepID=UPI0030CFCD0A